MSEVRRCGFMVGIELLEHPLPVRIGHQVTLEARRRGAIIRPLGDVVVLMPPLAIATDDLRRLVGITARRSTRRPRRRSCAKPPSGAQRGTGADRASCHVHGAPNAGGRDHRSTRGRASLPAP